MVFRVIAKSEDQLYEGLYFGSAASEGSDIAAVLHGGEESDIPVHCVIGEPDHCRGADPASWNVQDTTHGDLVLSVVDGLEVGDHVADLPAVVEIGSANHIVRDGIQHEPFLQCAGLRVGPVEDREIAAAKMSVRPHLPRDVTSDEHGLFPGRIELLQVEFRALAPVCPEGFLLSLYIVSDHRVRGVEHILRGTVILLEFDNKRIRIYLFKIQNVADVGASEAVDGLVVIADNAEIAVSVSEEPYQLKLRSVGVLILIHHDIAESVLIIGQHFVVGVKQFHGQHEQVVKIQRIVLFESFLIFVVGVRDPLIAETDACVFFPVLQRSDQLVFGRGDL